MSNIIYAYLSDPDNYCRYVCQPNYTSFVEQELLNIIWLRLINEDVEFIIYHLF